MCGFIQHYKWKRVVQKCQMSSYPLRLSFKKFGKECKLAPIIILHGLFGQKMNWNSIANVLQYRLETVVFSLDLRNHGDSPWHPTMTYAEMANDVKYFIDDILPQQIGKLSRIHLLGHSMGGKTAMHFALMEGSSERLKSLIIEDIAPKKYISSTKFPKIINAMKSINLNTSRNEIEQKLAQTITDRTLRMFLLMNLSRLDKQKYRWQLNLDSIQNCMHEISGNGIQDKGVYHGKCLFVSGANSDYIKPIDHTLILERFPKALFSVIAGASHWVHAEKPYEFTDVIADFISSVEFEHYNKCNKK
ncbi:unnamed protein product [Thelazia callipaeda]|uniref:sn-1-specific diacylglycerol lipase ABHD11 n=1 Tax=Thelazia callipaeda TaxID=103827 RepID=A0A0N5D715_THECL|nr:unnamed protein product [Thelazia callipaeda]